MTGDDQTFFDTLRAAERLTVGAYVAPDRFAPQTIAPSIGGMTYAAAATAASLEAVRELGAPVRASYGLDRANTLDVFTPAGAHDLPVLIFLHGGAWTAGYLWWSGFMAAGVLRLPAILVTPTYRLAPASRFPAALDDVAAAYAWVRKNIAAFGGDPRRVLIGGHSAGGHLAALYALSGRAETNDLIACLPISSSFDLRYPDARPGSGEERIYKYLLHKSTDDALASPIQYIDRARIPFDVTIGDGDFARVERTSRAFHTAMAQEGRDCRLTVVAGHDHFGTHLALRDPEHPWFCELARLMEAGERQRGLE